MESQDLPPLQEIIYSKIFLSLIFNYKGEEQSNEEEYGQDIEQLEKEINRRLEKNINILNESNELKIVTKNNIYEYKIDKLYLEILTQLIKEKKFKDYYYCLDLIKQLDLKNINITQTIYKGLSEVLDGDKPYMNAYNINDLEDFKDENKINFYYILIIYVFKNIIYIHNINFLIKNMNNFLKLIRNKSGEIKSLLMNIQINQGNENDSLSKIEEILSFFSKYYSGSVSNKTSINEGQSNNANNRRDRLDDLTKNLKKDSSIELNNKIEYYKAKQILTKLNLVINIFPKKDEENNFEYKEILYGEENTKMETKDDFKIDGNYDNITEEDRKISDAEIVYKNYKKLIAFIKEIEDYIKNSGIQFNPQIKLELIREDDEINAREEAHEYKDLYNITCNSTFKNQLKQDELLSFRDENILVHSINGKSQGFINLINELNNEDYLDEKFTYN